MKVIGRKNEIKELDNIMNSGKPEFVVVYGRRRVGKTFLVNQYFSDKFTFKLTGLAKKGKEDQLLNFTQALNRQGSFTYKMPGTWMEAFENLRHFLENSKTKKRRVVFIDELPFMDTPRSNMITALEHFWNDWASTQNDIVLIVCGSATSWITKKIIRNHGGLHNRLTRKIYLRPFSLAETNEYLQVSGFDWDEQTVAECYMIMGGIPFYLSLLDVWPRMWMSSFSCARASYLPSSRICMPRFSAIRRIISRWCRLSAPRTRA